MLKKLQSKSLKFSSEVCVVTGGEPTMYDLFPLTTSLHQIGKKTHLETSRLIQSPVNGIGFAFHQKNFKAPLPENMKLADELKIVVFNKSDLNGQKNTRCRFHHSATYFFNLNGAKKKKCFPDR
jgi:organic radical activating enzyme